MESSIDQDGEISFVVKYFRNHIYFLRHMTRISAISISLILVVYFLDQSGYQFPYLDFLCSSYTPDFLPTEKSTKGLAPIAGTNANVNLTDIFKSSNINNNIFTRITRTTPSESSSECNPSKQPTTAASRSCIEQVFRSRF